MNEHIHTPPMSSAYQRYIFERSFNCSSVVVWAPWQVEVLGSEVSLEALRDVIKQLSPSGTTATPFLLTRATYPRRPSHASERGNTHGARHMLLSVAIPTAPAV